MTGNPATQKPRRPGTVPTDTSSLPPPLCDAGRFDYCRGAMEGTRSFLQLRRAVRVQGRRVIARFLTKPNRGAVLTFPTHGDARRAAAKLLVQLRLSKTDEEWDEQLIFRVEFLSAYNALLDEDEE